MALEVSIKKISDFNEQFFSKKCEYGLQAILYLSAQDKESLCSAEEISSKLKIPKEFTSKYY